MATAEPVTVAVITFNGGSTLVETVGSLSRLAYPAFTLLVADNASTDDSLALLEARFPALPVIRLPDNRGPSAARNAALQASRTDLVFLSDNDITAEPDMLANLVNALRRTPRAAIVSPRILYSDRATVLSDGVRLHYLAVSMPRNRRLPAAAIPDIAPRIHPCASGGMMLVDKARLGPEARFDEDYFFGWDDVEFSFRQSLRGFAAVTVPATAIVHKEKSWGTKRSFFQIRNRWYLLLTTYSRKTILLILPMLAAYEAGLACLMLVKGEARTYLRAMREVVVQRRAIRAKRRAVQATRVVNDRDLLQAGEVYIEQGLITKPWVLAVVRAGNRILDLYWTIVRRFL